MKYLLWTIVICCVIGLIVSGLIQYRQAQEIKFMQRSMIISKIAIIELRNQNKHLADELYDIHNAVTPTHELPALASLED